MKIALIGNMNNNFFVVMRYLRDAGIDAHLFLYQNEQPHFFPENDTQDIQKWAPYIHKLSFQDSIPGILKTPGKIVKKELHGFDIFIGCGFSPAYLMRAGMRLSLFIPYSDTVDGLSSYPLKFKFWKRHLGSFFSRRLQRKSLQKTQCIGTSLLSPLMVEKLISLSLISKAVPLLVPMVYVTETTLEVPKSLSSIVAYMKTYDFVLFSHTRQKWVVAKNENDIDINPGGKRNDKLIRGFARFVKNHSSISSLLVLFDYGSDVAESKALIQELQIQDHVLWISTLPRKDILPLIQYATLCADEFSVPCLWGGVGWESICQGKMLLHYYGGNRANFEQRFGIKMPHFFDVQSEEEIAEALGEFQSRRAHYEVLSKENKTWFLENIVNKSVSQIIQICERLS